MEPTVNRAEYQDLRHRYRLAQREDARASQMNASEWKRGIHQDTAGPIKASVPADVAATLEHRDATPCHMTSEQLREALGRFYARRHREAARRNRSSVLQQAMARSRTMNRTEGASN